MTSFFAVDKKDIELLTSGKNNPVNEEDCNPTSSCDPDYNDYKDYNDDENYDDNNGEDPEDKASAFVGVSVKTF